MAAALEPTPTKPCHNCRRQRLRCDRSVPQCHKCTAAGKECLGYGQLFRWTGAVASRGKLAGHKSSAAVSNTKQLVHQRRSNGGSPVIKAESSRDSSSPPDSEGELVVHDGLSQAGYPSPWVLADPLWQDMTQSDRYYLSYFTKRLCKDLVSDDADVNPFRGLIPLTKAHPLLQNVIVAASAAHMSNLMKISYLSPEDVDETSLMPVSGTGAAKQVLQDALVAKQKALRLMHSALANYDSLPQDILLAAALFFVNVELIESGKHGWSAHLEGACRIMNMLSEKPTRDEVLRDYLVSDCLTYVVLGSAFRSVVAKSDTLFMPSELPSSLRRAAANNYICCPPEVLEILYSAAQLSQYRPEDEEVADQVASAGADLFRQGQAVDIEAWVESSQSPSCPLDTSLKRSRFNTASAHKLATCLYILQAIPGVGSRLGSEAALSATDKLFEHLSFVPDEDPNFKATTWATFIFGAETTDPELRQWVLHRLRRLVMFCPWGFIFTEMEALQVIWKLPSDEQENRSWVQKLKDPELNFLMV